MPKQATIDFILEKVAPIFNRQGYIGTSMSDLTAATQLTKGAIYGNFANKEDLAVQAFRYNARWVLRPLQEKVKQAATGYDQLVVVLDYHRSYMERARKIGGCPIMNVGVDAKHNNPKLYELARTVSKRLMADLTQILEQGKQDRSLRSDIDAELWSRNIYSMIDGAVFMTSTHEDDSYMHGILDYLQQEISKKLKS